MPGRHRPEQIHQIDRILDGGAEADHRQRAERAEREGEVGGHAENDHRRNNRHQRQRDVEAAVVKHALGKEAVHEIDQAAHDDRKQHRDDHGRRSHLRVARREAGLQIGPEVVHLVCPLPFAARKHPFFRIHMRLRRAAPLSHRRRIRRARRTARGRAARPGRRRIWKTKRSAGGRFAAPGGCTRAGSRQTSLPSAESPDGSRAAAAAGRRTGPYPRRRRRGRGRR